MISMSGLSDLAATAMPEIKPAAADRHDQHVEVGHRRQHLQRDGALTGDDQGIVVGMDEGQARVSRHVRWPDAAASSSVAPPSITVAPCRRVFSIFTVGVPTGTKMVAGMESRAA